ncbi:MAG: diaminopimelate epimerase [Rhodospirillales bacterium]|nr:diaminopimelate epimerase [Rhodospirillales bacterium]
MRAAFVKMHGAGNDFAVFDERREPLGLTPALAAALADRHRGIGCDQVISIERSARADAYMRIRNADGSEAGACGNATRCVAALLAGEDRRQRLTIETISGLLPTEILGGGLLRVDMGPPALLWNEIPLARRLDTLALPPTDGWPAAPAVVSMGNPHATFFVPDAEVAEAAAIGPRVERDPLFPERVNVGFASLLGPNRLRLRVWERGAGLTRACGSGACAAVVNACRLGLAGRRVDVVMDGGTLAIEWRADGHVLMTGPALIAFRGEIDFDTYPR